jgi:hypothetical protein
MSPVPQIPALEAALDALFARLDATFANIEKAADALAPGSGAAIAKVIAADEPLIRAGVSDVVSIVAAAALELGGAVRTLHAPVVPDVTDAG